ncbi:MAG: NAD-dependent malic enzyme [Methylothermaceae bacterium]|nr:NAD-dependent malic enzyme [Methylothermaceae bacterium]
MMKTPEPPPGLTGMALLANPKYNKSTAFTEAERDRYKLRGLLPAVVSTQSMQIRRVLENLRRKAYDIERYVFLMALQSRNERLFYRLLIEHTDEILPLVYTPTVGQACLEFAHIFRQPRGFYLTPEDRGRIAEILENWPHRDVRLIVVTDGERILGLGDLGANGMGIPIGKLALYSAFAGIEPEHCLPVMLDVGTNNRELRDDPLYLGTKPPRIRGDAYIELVDEFVTAVQKRYPRALIQFEDFITPNAYLLLNRYRKRVLCFNDDIQGTAAVALAGVLAYCRLTDQALKDLRILFLGAGSAATGIADLIQTALLEAGLTREKARRRLWFVDIHGLMVKDRDDLLPHNLPYAHDAPRLDFIEAIQSVRPHALIGATGAPGTFTQEVIQTMASIHRRPLIFALSNPTSRAECSAEEAYRWSEGRAVFAGGSPFPPVALGEQTFHPAQANNAHIFPGIGLGALASNARRISDKMFLKAAKALASCVTDEDLNRGALYPPLPVIRQASLSIAVAVANQAWEENLARSDRPGDLQEVIRSMRYDPWY